MQQVYLSEETAQQVDGAPTVSIIIPAYLDSQYIGEALDSVLGQTFTDYEIIVVNDGSPDTKGLEQALEPYRERIIYIKQENLGPSAARNTAIHAAAGEFIAFLDADDYWEPNYLSEQIAFIKDNPVIDLAYTDALLIGDLAMAGRTYMDTVPSKGDVTLESLLSTQCTVILSGALVRRRAVLDIGLFDENLRYAEDYDLWLRLANHGARLAYQRKVLLCKRMHSQSLCANATKLFENVLRVLDKTALNNNLSQQEHAALKMQVERTTADLWLEYGKIKLSSGDFAGSIEAYKSANEFYHSWKLRAVQFWLSFSPRLLQRIYRMRSNPTPDPTDSYQQSLSSLTAQVTWVTFARTVAFALSFVVPLLLVRRLSQHEFGVYKQAFLIVATAMALLPFGFGMSAFYFLPRKQVRQDQIIINILLFYIVMGGLSWLVLSIHPRLLATIFNSAELIEYAPLIGLVILLWMVATLLELVAIAKQEARLATLFILGSQFTRSLFFLIATLSFTSVRALIYAGVIQGVLQLLVLLAYLRLRFGPFWRSFDLSVMRKQLAYALPFGVASMLFQLQWDLPNYFVSYRFSAETYAIYAIGCFELPLITILSDSINSVMIPRVSYLQNLGKHREIIELVAGMMRKQAAVYLPLYVFLLVTGPEFITTLFTEQYLASWPIFAINLTWIPLGIIANCADPVMRAYPEYRYFLIRVYVVLFVALLMSLWFVTKHYHLVGTIMVVISVGVIARLVTAIKAARILEVKRSDLVLLKDLGKLAIAAAGAGILLAVARWLMHGALPLVVLVVGGAFFSLVYVAAILLLGVPGPGEREKFRRWISPLYRFIPETVSRSLGINRLEE